MKTTSIRMDVVEGYPADTIAVDLFRISLAVFITLLAEPQTESVRKLFYVFMESIVEALVS